MKIPDLYLLIKHLEGKERTRFRKFLASPYFNSDEKHIELFAAVEEQVKEESYDREALDAIIYPNESFSYTRITNLISDLKKLVEEFLVQEELKKQTFYGEFLLLKAMEEKSFSKFFGQSEERIKKQLVKEPLHTEEYFLQNFLLEDESYQFSLKNPELEGAEHIGKKIKSLHLFYVMAMLKSVCQDLNQRANKGASIHTQHRFFIQYILNNQKLYIHEPKFRLYIRVLRILESPLEIHHVESLTQELLATQDLLSMEASWTLFTYVQDYKARMQADFEIAGKVKALLFSLYLNFMNAKGGNWPIQEGFLSPSDGLQFLFLAVSSGNDAAAEKFISDYASYSHSAETNNALAFYQAYFLFKVKKERKKSREMLEGHDFTQTVFFKESTLLLTEVYYDSYEDQELIQLWEGVITTLKKDKGFSMEDREIFGERKKLVSKLLKLRRNVKISRPSVFEKNREKLKSEIKREGNTSFSSWLLKELQQIERVS